MEGKKKGGKKGRKLGIKEESFKHIHSEGRTQKKNKSLGICRGKDPLSPQKEKSKGLELVHLPLDILYI